MIKCKKITVTATQIATWNSVRVELMAAPPTGYIHNILAVTLKTGSDFLARDAAGKIFILPVIADPSVMSQAFRISAALLDYKGLRTIIGQRSGASFFLDGMANGSVETDSSDTKGLLSVTTALESYCEVDSTLSTGDIDIYITYQLLAVE